MKTLTRTGFVALLLCMALLPPAANALQVSAGFLSPNPQIFPVGDMVDINQLNEGGDLDWDSFPEIVFVQISDLQGSEGDTEAYVRIYLNVNGTPLLNWISVPFTLHQWVDNSPNGNGRYTNPELSQITFTSRDEARSYQASMNEFLGLLDGANLASNLFTLGVEVYNADTGNLMTPGGSFLTT
ncbi:MAG TPA: hypothetical protein ENL08_04185, partial [Bacteroidetes bacterium]|nr:hypothetical protein [Bacteroidota bacterium]